MSVSAKLAYLSDTKNALREAINAAGGSLTTGDTFRSYADPLIFEFLVNKLGGLDLDYVNQRYRVYDPALGALVEKPWGDIVNNYSAPAGRTYFDSSGVLQTAGTNEPVIAYDPVSGEVIGNQIWGSYSNLHLHSANPLGSGWTRTLMTVTDEGDGVHSIAPNNSSGNAYIGQGFVFSTLDNNATMTLYYDVKIGDYRYFRIQGKTKSNSYPYGVFDLQEGVVTTSGAATGLITPVDDGYYRCSITWDVGSGSEPSYLSFAGPVNSGTGNFIVSGADGVKKIYMRRSQLSVSNIVQPYVETGSSQVTIAAENQIIDGTVFSGMWGAEGNTILCIGRSKTPGAYYWETSNGTTTDRRLVLRQSGDFVRAYNVYGGTTVATATFVDADNHAKIAYSAKNEVADMHFAESGDVLTFPAASVPADPNRLRIGSTVLGAGTPLNGHIERLVLFRRALPPSIIQRLTV